MASTKPIHAALNALDHLPPPNYASFNSYLPLKQGVSCHDFFKVLQEGLRRTFDELPWLDGKVCPVASTAPNYRPGALEVRYQPRGSDARLPYQLKFNELDTEQTYEDIRELAFHPEIFDDSSLTWYPFLPDVTTEPEVFVAQANFLPGGCILTTAMNHSVTDGTGLNVVLGIWANNCKNVQLGRKLYKAHPPEISDHTLLDRTFTKEGTENLAEAIPLDTWRLINLEPPEDLKPRVPPTNGRNAPAAKANNSKPKEAMKSYIFYLSPESINTLRKECISGRHDISLSINDVISALVWRSLLKARMSTKPTMPDDQNSVNDPENSVTAQLDLPFDVRPYFDGDVPATYLGNFTLVNQAGLPLSTLISPTTTLGDVARAIRQVAGEVTPTRLKDAYTLAKALPRLGRGRSKLENLRVDGTGLIITSLLAYEMGRISFGNKLLANGGRPEAIRPVMGAINQAFRYCAFLPRKEHGGVEFVANLLNREMEALMMDNEFGKYALFVG